MIMFCNFHQLFFEELIYGAPHTTTLGNYFLIFYVIKEIGNEQDFLLIFIFLVQ